MAAFGRKIFQRFQFGIVAGQIKETAVMTQAETIMLGIAPDPVKDRKLAKILIAQRDILSAVISRHIKTKAGGSPPGLNWNQQLVIGQPAFLMTAYINWYCRIHYSPLCSGTSKIRVIFGF